MRVVKMLKLACGPDGNREIGKLYPMPAAEADMLKAAGAAEDPTAAELRKFGGPAGAQPADDSDFDDTAADDSEPETATNTGAETAETAAQRTPRKSPAKPKAKSPAKPKAKAKGGKKSPAAAAADALK